MRHGRLRPLGFSLIELLLVMVLLGIASAVIMSLNVELFSRRGEQRELRLAAPCIESCAEQLLARRHAVGGYAALSVDACSAVAGAALTLSDANGDPVSTCAGTAHCTATIACASVRAATLRFYDY